MFSRPLKKSGKAVLSSKAPEGWKTNADVKKVSFAVDESGHLIRLGGHAFGNQFVGRIHFKDGSTHRVSIKRFNTALSNEGAMKYRKVIYDLALAGVKLPKMDMIKLKMGARVDQDILEKDEWVQVSQLFGSTGKGSKLENKQGVGSKNKKAKIDFLIELTKVANAGYRPVLDLAESFKKDPGKILPMDLDQIVRSGKIPTTERVKSLIYAINSVRNSSAKKRKLISNFVNAINSTSINPAEKEKAIYNATKHFNSMVINPGEGHKLLNIVIQHASPALKNEIIRMKPGFKEELAD